MLPWQRQRNSWRNPCGDKVLYAWPYRPRNFSMAELNCAGSKVSCSRRRRGSMLIACRTVYGTALCEGPFRRQGCNRIRRPMAGRGPECAENHVFLWVPGPLRLNKAGHRGRGPAFPGSTGTRGTNCTVRPTFILSSWPFCSWSAGAATAASLLQWLPLIQLEATRWHPVSTLPVWLDAAVGVKQRSTERGHIPVG